MKPSFLFLILEDQVHGHVGLTIDHGHKVTIHLPRKGDTFAPFGAMRQAEGKVSIVDGEIRQVIPHVGQMIRLQNNESKETKTYKVLFVGTKVFINLSDEVNMLLANHIDRLLQLNDLTSVGELFHYTQIIYAFLKTITNEGIRPRYNCVSYVNFIKNNSVPDEYVEDMDEAKLVFVNKNDTVHLDAAMWYLLIFKLNKAAPMHPPFAYTI